MPTSQKCPKGCGGQWVSGAVTRERADPLEGMAGFYRVIEFRRPFSCGNRLPRPRAEAVVWLWLRLLREVGCDYAA